MILPDQIDADNTAWFRENQADIPCMKLTEEGFYDLSPLKN